MKMHMPYNTPTLVIELFGHELEFTFFGFAKGVMYNNPSKDIYLKRVW